MYNPVSTYRIQFNKAFSLADFEETMGYLQKLGVNTIYASPIFESAPESAHGYDTVNPHKINPEIGSLDELERICKKLRDQGIGWIQDIVPNHMAYHSNNEWLMDVLEKGDRSAFKCFFDLFYADQSFFDRPIMVPFLGSDLNSVLEKGELRIVYEKSKLKFSYFDRTWPLRLRSYSMVLKNLQEADSELVEHVNKVDQIDKIKDAINYSNALNKFQNKLAFLTKKPVIKKWLQKQLTEINQDKEMLNQIVIQQEYRLCFWQETDLRINYRRFFTVNGLICLNMQHAKVFEYYHQFINVLLEKQLFQGLRIDHIDGLFNPEEYLHQLRKVCGDETYLTVEKILEAGEELPKDWPIQGTTGYDFLALVNNLFTQKFNEPYFTTFYAQLSDNHLSISKQILEKKRNILYQHMGGELQNLCDLFLKSELLDKKRFAEFDINHIKKAIGEFLVHCPVYRYYGNSFSLISHETSALQQVFNEIRKNTNDIGLAVDVLEDVLLNKVQKNNKEYKSRALHFYQRCMQFSGPLMAKGIEDTLMYAYSRFIGHNEVGDSLCSFGISPENFHQKMIERQEKWPLSLNATSTHDTKRGEDVRSRLNVLTDLGTAWFATIKEWQELNKDLKGNDFPNNNEEYFIYQTLIGSYPMPGQDGSDYENRIQEYLKKAFREAKQHSNWTEPNEGFEALIKEFTVGLLDKSRPFWKNFEELHHRLSDFGIINSLAQVLLKFTCPGIPDIYQGCELWDLSLVDPDNRRAVDYEQRQQWLDEIKAYEGTIANKVSELWESRYSGKIKLWLVHILLNERKIQHDVFTYGGYIPLQIKGRYKKHVIAFARKGNKTWYIIAVPIHLIHLNKGKEKELKDLDWEDTRIIIPTEAPYQCENLFMDTQFRRKESIFLNEIFNGLPLALLKLEKADNNRSAGVLMHISSLPAPFGIGDLGPGAYDFSNFLSKTCQRYWQVLPLNPIELSNGYSPYSSNSSMAGNTLFISPELLVKEGYLKSDSLKGYYLPSENKVDYQRAERIKNKLHDLAWDYFSNNENTFPSGFRTFCEQETYWLGDYALYAVIKQQQGGKPWYDWPDKYKFRDTEELHAFSSEHRLPIDKAKWLQYVFSKQWKNLKAYCNQQGIKLFGDLPFYVSYDSVDVWAHKELFSIDNKGNVVGMGGVPPDYFNENGQLWGMPVFRWDVLKKQHYKWWLQRIGKNLEMYDLLRLDHFRAFSAYWEVPNGETTAIKGEWKAGPGIAFFNALIEEFGELPLVAEDLGDIDEAVYALRDKFKLPGMKVLQFAFGDDLSVSDYAPHNYTSNFFVYSGTHDNNTTKAWFKEDVTTAIKKQIKEYTGIKVRKNNIHEIIIRLAFSSVAKTAIVPLQDLLGLGKRARMNTPASLAGNWLWRLKTEQLSGSLLRQLKIWTKLYNRE